MVMFNMFTVVSEKLQIFRAVIISDFIDMVNKLITLKEPPNNFLNDKISSFYITVSIGPWVSFLFYKHIAMIIIMLAAFPIRMFSPFLKVSPSCIGYRITEHSSSINFSQFFNVFLRANMAVFEVSSARIRNWMTFFIKGFTVFTSTFSAAINSCCSPARMDKENCFAMSTYYVNHTNSIPYINMIGKYNLMRNYGWFLFSKSY